MISEYQKQEAQKVKKLIRKEFPDVGFIRLIAAEHRFGIGANFSWQFSILLTDEDKSIDRLKKINKRISGIWEYGNKY